ncbi:MAG: hypothetical protein M9910_08735 [Kiritimatiellae bacterium]|nr:hypothetical protein [Kiritimatiellia bacterium]
MGVLSLRGSTAERDLERLLTMNVSTIAEGQARYGYLLNEQGGCLDDLTCYRFGPAHFWLIVNAGTRESDLEWIRAHISPTTELEDPIPALRQARCPGPPTRADLEAALGEPLPDLRYFRFVSKRLAGIPTVIQPHQLTGEWGYELLRPHLRRARLLEIILKPGAIKPAGLGARGYAPPRIRLSAIRPRAERRAFARRRVARRLMDFAEDFIGAGLPARSRPRLRALPVRPPTRLETRRPHPRQSDARRQEIGEVTSGSLAPSEPPSPSRMWIARTHRKGLEARN